MDCVMHSIQNQYSDNMLLDSLQSIIQTKSDIPALMIFGEEEFLRDEAYHAVMEKFVPAGNTHNDIDILDAEQAKESAIVDIACSFPFISEKKIVVVKNVEKLFSSRGNAKKQQSKSALIKYLESPQPTTFLLLTGTVSDLSGITAAQKNPKMSEKAKKILSSAKYPLKEILDLIPCLECAKVGERDIASWTSKRLSSFGKEINPEAAEYLIANAGTSLRDIANELEKLMLFAPDKKRYTEQEVLGLVGSSRVYNVFELQKAIGEKNRAKSIEILHHMMKDESQEMLIITMLTRYFVVLFKLSEANASNQNPYELAKSVGISPFFIPEYQAALRHYSPRKINSCFYLLRNADLAVKTTSDPAIIILQRLILGLLG